VILSLVRDERGPDDGVEGRLFRDGALVGPTLERGAVAIPFGSWPIRAHQSPKFGRRTLLIDCGRGYTLIHAGGIPSHSEGCVLLGRDDLAGSRISGGAPIVAWLEREVLAEIDAGREVRIVVHQIGGDVADGVLV